MNMRLIITIKKIAKLVLILILLFSQFIQVFSYKVEPWNQTVNIHSEWVINMSKWDSFYKKLAKTFTEHIWFFTWVVAFIIVITAWFYLLNSQWTPEDLKKANKMLIRGMVWIFLSLLSYWLIKVLINLF